MDEGHSAMILQRASTRDRALGPARSRSLPRRWLPATMLVAMAGCILALLRFVPLASAADRTVFVGHQPAAIAVDAAAGRVLVVDYGDDTLNVFDTDGTLLRALPIGSSSGPIAVDERGGRAFVVADGGSSIRLIETRSGRLLHTTSLNSAERPSLLLDPRSGHLFVSTETGLAMLDSRSGALLRMIPLAVAPNALGELAMDTRAGRLFAVDRNDALVIALSTRDGRVLGALHTASGPTSIAADETAHRLVVVNAGAYSVSIFDTRSSALVRTVPLAPGPLAVDELTGRIFIATYGSAACGNVYTLDAVSGRVLRVACLSPLGGSFSAIAVNGRAGRVYIASDSGISVLDARTGVPLRQPSLGIAGAVGVAVDERIGRAFVIGQQSLRDSPAGYSDSGPAAWLSEVHRRFPWLPHPPLPTPIPVGSGVMGLVNSG